MAKYRHGGYEGSLCAIAWKPSQLCAERYLYWSPRGAAVKDHEQTVWRMAYLATT